MRKLDLFIGLVFVVSTIALGLVLLPLQLLPTHTTILLFFGLMALILLYFLGSMAISTNVFHTIRRSLAIMICTLLLVGSIGFLEFDNAISQMTDMKDTTIHVRLLALNQNSDDLADYHKKQVGIFAHDYDYQQALIDYVREKNKVTLKAKTFPSAQTALEALLQQKIPAIIVSSATYEELDKQFQIANQLRLVYEYTIEPTSSIDVLTTPFHILIQGIDRVGSSSALARSDFNMIASINLNTKQILLTSIPRDGFLKNPCLQNQYDKLTHISLQGSQCSVQALAAYLNIPIAYYVKLSFTSVINLINTIGGIKVNVPMTFCEYDETKKGVIYIKKGDQVLDGRQALAFARHRYTLYDGDLGRNLNQQLLVNALIKKTASPQLLTNIDQILGIMKKTVQTSLNTSQIYSLIRFHFDDQRPYLVENQSIIGQPAARITANLPYQKVSVVMLHSESSKKASIAMNQLLTGIDLSTFTYKSKALTTPFVQKQTTGAKGTNRCHIP